MMRDWNAWHDDYADPESELSQRLRTVQRHIKDWMERNDLDSATIVSSCAGDGRDLLDVLEVRDSDRFTVSLLEADPEIARRARSHALRVGLTGVTVRCVDAGFTDAYVGAVPADLILLCGIFGNIDDADIQRTIAALPQLCNAAATVIWTRHRRAPDLTPQIREWFHDRGFQESSFVAPEHAIYSVGVHRYLGDPQSLAASQRLFAFIN